MINRRNDRRRRLMSEEYVSTFVEEDDSTIAQNTALETTESARRAYAFGADRRSQLKTTDLFPKRMWLIAFFGLVLLGLIAGLNVLNIYAPAWRPYIGQASVRAISLTGPGTLVSWMLSMMLGLTGLASLQIFALRKHRCDDYGGTYRIWLIIPPIFFVASISAIVDFEAIIAHLASLAQLTSVANESLIPMTIKLSLLALVMLRMLYEIRNSRSAFAMLVVAWLAVAISTVLNTQWAQQRIGSQELALAYPNAVLVATISLLLSHLLYVRFVYLHAHGVIAVKQRGKTEVQQSDRPTVAKKSRSVSTADENHKAETQASQPAGKRSTKLASKTKPSQQTPVRQTSARKTPVQQNIAKPTTVESAAPQATPTQPRTAQPPSISNTAKKKSATMSDFQALLKQKQAQKAAAEQGEAQHSAADSPLTSERDDAGNEAVIKMSKSERRRARKAAKAKRRAA